MLPRAINNVACAIKLYWKSWLNNEIATTRFYSLLYTLKSPLAPAAHLSAEIDIKFCIALTRLRTGSHYLLIVTDAWRNIERDDRICNLCKHDVGDEFHFLFTCTALNDLKETFINNVFIAKFTFYALRRFCV